MEQNTSTESLEFSEDYTAEVKGPNPEVWGADEDRPQPVEQSGDLTVGDSGLGIGEIQNEGTPEEVKGPGEEWEQDEHEGVFVNR